MKVKPISFRIWIMFLRLSWYGLTIIKATSIKDDKEMRAIVWFLAVMVAVVAAVPIDEAMMMAKSSFLR